MSRIDKSGKDQLVQPVVATGANPAAGTEFTITVPAGETWLLKSLSVQLVQGITQTPQPLLRVVVAGSVVFEGFGSSAAQAASTTCQYTWAPGLALTGQVGATPNIRSHGAIPSDLILPAGSNISSVTLGIGANTDYGVPAALVEKL